MLKLVDVGVASDGSDVMTPLMQRWRFLLGSASSWESVGTSVGTGDEDRDS